MNHYHIIRNPLKLCTLMVNLVYQNSWNLNVKIISKKNTFSLKTLTLTGRRSGTLPPHSPLIPSPERWQCLQPWERKSRIGSSSCRFSWNCFWKWPDTSLRKWRQFGPWEREMRRRVGVVRLWSPPPLGLILRSQGWRICWDSGRVARAPAQDRVPLPMTALFHCFPISLP